MEKPTVYIESSVISYYASRRTRDIIVAAHQEITIEWWEETLPKIHPFISQVIIDEISRGDLEASQKRLHAIKEFELLEITDETLNLASIYFKALKIPDKARADSIHMALAVYHGTDYMVTWNCTHIAAARIRYEIERINNKKGYFTPVICTPEELMEV